MLDTQLVLFLITSLLVIITPGQDMVLIMSRSIALGTKAGVTTAAGVSTGLLGHTLLAALGLGAILQTSELLFTVMKFVGAGYLVYLGVKMFRAPAIELDQSASPSGALRKLFFQGAMSNLSNPKRHLLLRISAAVCVDGDGQSGGGAPRTGRAVFTTHLLCKRTYWGMQQAHCPVGCEPAPRSRCG